MSRAETSDSSHDGRDDHHSDHHHHDRHRAGRHHLDLHRSSAGADRRWLVGGLTLVVAFMLVEVVFGVVAGSLALLSDAAHMLTDAASIGLALVAMRLALRPPRGGYTYGLRRAEILSAQANGIALLVLASWLGYEAVRRLRSPPPVAGTVVLLVALVGITVNIAAAALIARANRRSLNVEGAYQHILTDLFAFIATAVAGLVIVVSGWVRADAVASLVVVALMVRAGLVLVRDSGRVLLEAAPAGLDPDRIGRDMAAVPGVMEVHDLHVWEITSGAPALSAHVIVRAAADCHGLRGELEDLLRKRYELTHTTLQVDHGQPELYRIAGSA